MTRRKRLESHGWKVIVFMSGDGCQAVKNNYKVTGTSITDLHYKIFGY
jgi:hypothetical protein